ncbi:zinc transport system substrate-binding protein [Pedococcus dokdonensis]|uniref:Zinc transport system substrate-binding protein n=1 Tax=Pedococcus dokdonensis TaxID=443156 RepID=A0A1H0Q1A6_9MICO|nr:zinc ABC transporter substrate-binding protein [Pedococcus dokdonensis]SDP11221.1 zinc transport system substrate-binding protein [Pedococcus dokdonensis]
MTLRLPGLAAGLLSIAMVSACGATGGRGADDGRLSVVAAFYPLEYAVQQVGGTHVDVQGLTKPGAEPHDLELTPRQVAKVAQADVVVYEEHFQPAVDAAVAQQAGRTSLDVSTAARLDLALVEDGHDHGDEHAGETEEQTETDDQHADHGARDPHFWLDPMRYADVGDAIAARLAERDPGNAAAYRANAAAFRASMRTLDGEFRTGLASCATKELVTSHAAFGYLSQTYGFHQESITGLSPDAEPSPAAMAELTAHIRETGATTVYAETLVSQDVARTLARETGARLAVLDPIEGITSASAGRDYPSVMRANLQVLRAGQECS